MNFFPENHVFGLTLMYNNTKHTPINNCSGNRNITCDECTFFRAVHFFVNATVQIIVKHTGTRNSSTVPVSVASSVQKATCPLLASKKPAAAVMRLPRIMPGFVRW